MKTYIRCGVDPTKTYSTFDAIALGALGSNLGNMLFQNSVWNLIKNSEYNEPVAMGHDLHSTQAKILNQCADKLVLPLANCFRPEFAKTLQQYTELIEKLNIPVIVIGAGCQTNLNFNLKNLNSISSISKRFVSAVLDRSNSIGVRGECTYNYLRNLGFADNCIDIIGCPSMYTFGNHLPPTSEISKLNTIAINVSSINRQCEYSSGLEVTGAHISKVFREFPKSILIPQEQKTLEWMLYRNNLDTVQELAILDRDIINILKSKNRIVTFTDPSSWIQYLTHLDACIGTRIHGNIAGILAGKPALVIAHDSRTLELCQYHKIPYVCTNSLDKDNKKNLISILQSSNYKEMHEAHQMNFKRYTKFLIKNNIIKNEDEAKINITYNSNQVINLEKIENLAFSTMSCLKLQRYIYRNKRKYGFFNVYK